MHSRFVFVIIFLFSICGFLQYPAQVDSLNNTNNVIKNSTWISTRDNLVIKLDLIPKIPVIDEMTKLLFEVRDLNGSYLDNLNTKVTLTDHDGRLYKFENRSVPILNGQFFVDYIFPDDGEHRVILQIYENTTPFALSSFDIWIPHAVPQTTQDKLFDPLLDFFNIFQ